MEMSLYEIMFELRLKRDLRCEVHRELHKLLYNPLYNDTTLICQDGTISVNRLAVCLLFPFLNGPLCYIQVRILILVTCADPLTILCRTLYVLECRE